jgi:hypothetical protein
MRNVFVVFLEYLVAENPYVTLALKPDIYSTVHTVVPS